MAIGTPLALFVLVLRRTPVYKRAAARDGGRVLGLDVHPFTPAPFSVDPAPRDDMLKTEGRPPLSQSTDEYLARESLSQSDFAVRSYHAVFEVGPDAYRRAGQ